MNFNEEDIRSDVGFVCIGQAAGNIGLLFEEKGYNVLYINTSSEDLALLKNAKHVYHVPNGEGCAKDRDKAKYHLANDIDHLLDLIETKVPQKNVFVVFASGGGTGSGISPYLLNILVEKFSTDEDGELSANPAKLFSAITILPSDSEPLQPAINSYSCCKEILDIENLGTVFFIDNNSMEDKMKINKVCIKNVNDLNYGLVDYVYLQDKKKGIGVRFPVEGVDSDISEEAFIDIVLQACISYAKSESKIQKCSDIRYAVKNHTLRIKLSYKGLAHTIDACMIAGEILDLNVLIQSVISNNDDSMYRSFIPCNELERFGYDVSSIVTTAIQDSIASGFSLKSLVDVLKELEAPIDLRDKSSMYANI